MRFVIKLIGLVVLAGLAAVALFVADAVWNASRLFYAAAGRDGLIHDCTPMTKEALIGKGFSPTDLEFDDHPALGFSYGADGRVRSLNASFRFSDGPNGPAVAGRLACVAAGKSITVDVEVDDLPRRMT